MVSENERRLVKLLVLLRVWRVERGLFRTPNVIAPKGTRWLLNWLKRRQRVDNFHHAPACPANHWCMQRLVFSGCTCGAEARGIVSAYDTRPARNRIEAATPSRWRTALREIMNTKAREPAP